jgi:hypothetical protein
MFLFANIFVKVPRNDSKLDSRHEYIRWRTANLQFFVHSVVPVHVRRDAGYPNTTKWRSVGMSEFSPSSYPHLESLSSM